MASSSAASVSQCSPIAPTEPSAGSTARVDEIIDVDKLEDEPKGKRQKNLTSAIWTGSDYTLHDVVEEVDGKKIKVQYAKCNHCSKYDKPRDSKNGTSVFRNHLKTHNVVPGQQVLKLDKNVGSDTAAAPTVFRHHKRWLAEKLGPDAANSEHEFTRKMLAIDAKNNSAWSHRQWVLQALGGWESELQYCNQLLEEDVFNNSAWNQRYLVITRSPLLGGLVAMRDSEVDYTVEAIMANPRNESPWRYLKGLYKGDNYLLVADRRISDVCLKVLKDDSTYIFALSLLVDLLRMGLQPSDELKGTIESIENSDPETSHVDLATALCSILQKCDPLRINYWSWYRTTLS